MQENVEASGGEQGPRMKPEHAEVDCGVIIRYPHQMIMPGGSRPQILVICYSFVRNSQCSQS
jgi:hypothetical protein